MVSTFVNPSKSDGRQSFAHLPQILEVPNLIEVQLNSFRWFQEKGLEQLFKEISPIKDFTGSRLDLSFVGYEFREPRYNEQECRQRDLTYSAPLYVTARLLVKETGEIKETPLFFGDIPLMTAKGTFITSGAERIVVSQLLRSPGVYFTAKEDPSTGRILCSGKIIPTRGAWLEFETSNRDVIAGKIDGKRKIPMTTLLRAIGYGTDEELENLFKDADKNPDHQYMKSTMDRDLTVKDRDDALIDIYRKLRPGDPPNRDNAEKLINNLFFDPARYDLGTVGRYKLNSRLGLDISGEMRALTREDIIEIIRHIILINNEKDHGDDIDHLGNRRVRTVGELLQNQFRIGLLRLERVVKERMSIIPTEAVTAAALVNIRPVVAAVREFFGGSQLSQFMDQTNPLAEVTHKRRLSAMGPGGLSRERAGFDVRDVHYSHYGRICPIETPEGPNIGLIGSLATYSKINEYGFIESPYRMVFKELNNKDKNLLGRTIRETLKDKDGKPIIKSGAIISDKILPKLAKLSKRKIKVTPFVPSECELENDDRTLVGLKVLETIQNSKKKVIVNAGNIITEATFKEIAALSARTIKVQNVEYLSADKEDKYVVAQANANLDELNQFVGDTTEARQSEHYMFDNPEEVDLIDVSPKQIVSVATALIPFLEHDDANRALMGANMQRQAVPLLRAEAPLVATGMEAEAARHSGQLLVALNAGTVSSASGYEDVDKKDNGESEKISGYRIIVAGDNGGEDTYELMKYVRTNQGTCIIQKPIVNKGDHVDAGTIIADSSAIERGELALGHNVICAFASWEGYNYEDAIVISSRLVEQDKFTSIHIEKHEVEARDTKLGPEEITRDIPNVGEESLRELDEHGIIRIGAEVNPGDILVGKISPKGETELSAEEKLLRAIFGEKAREVKDTSLRVPHGEWGKVINVKVFSRENSDEIPAGVNQWVQVWVAQKRKVSVGDKISGRHGNKGVVSLIANKEDMPFLPDGTPVDIVLNPIGVPSRMNLGQILETHLGWVSHVLGIKMLTPVFDGAKDSDIEGGLARVWLMQKAGAVELNPLDDKPELDMQKAEKWLTDQGYDPAKVFDNSRPDEAKRVCLGLWLQEIGISGDHMELPELEKLAKKVSSEKNLASPITGKVILRDGRTGEPFDQPVTIGDIYMLKLIHLVEDKVHARSTGPYSLIAQQPLGGKAQFGGQRFGEMEVWTLEAYGAAHNLQEILTIKSDDVTGRAKTYEAIVKNEDIIQPGVPESFKVLVKELQSLGLAIEVINEEEAGEPPELTAEHETIPGNTEVEAEKEVKDSHE